MNTKSVAVRRVLRRSVLVVFAAALTGCKFESDIVPLILPTAPPQAFQSSVDPAGETSGMQPESAGGGARWLAGFDSSAAMAQCGEELSWGDADVGMCDVPSKDTFYVWVSTEQVYEIEAGSPYVAQFLAAAENRVVAADSYAKETDELEREVGGLFVEMVLAIPACASLVFCIADGAAMVLTGLAIAESGQSLIDFDNSIESATRNAAFYLCLMQGTPEAQCRETHLGGGTP